jgi:iron complex transport system substrate-binding protein
MRAVPAAVLAVLAAAPLARAAEPPSRIVSLNKCADQLLVALVEPSRIASVSPIAADEFAFMADVLARVPANSGRGETILMDGGDFVLAGSFGTRPRIDLLRRQGFEVMTLDPWTSLDDGRRQIRAVARRLAAEGAGERLVGRIDASLAAASGTAPPRTMLVLQHGGSTPGQEGVVNEILRAIGLVPYAERLGLSRGGRVSLERVVAEPPDYLLVPTADAGSAYDLGSAFLHHPALLEAVPLERRLTVPARLSLCGGPATPVLIETLAAEVRAKVR